ncbi:SIMPL domain-containing protein [Virgibacillus xinjiangensis]|uniref:SIMPL domain-containing protein n=1 Tax=Virgibacillus xinjiangensis TaxID=393090 RepID=A0ABV7CZC5_9BACI
MYYYPVSYRQQNGPRRVITVDGKGSVSAAPDAASVQLGVVTENDMLAQAQEENNATMNRVLEALRDQGIPAEDIRTTVYQIEPRYDYVDGAQVFRGYEVRHEVTVTISDLARIGRVIDAAVQSGANRVSGVQFFMANQGAAYQQALQKAYENAVAKAAALAAAMQVSLDVTPIHITEQSTPTIQPYTAVALAEDAGTPIEPGQLTVTAEIEAAFMYGPGQ